MDVIQAQAADGNIAGHRQEWLRAARILFGVERRHFHRHRQWIPQIDSALWTAVKLFAANDAARSGTGTTSVKLRSGARPGDLSGVDTARRLAEAGVVAGICIHPRHASQRHSGKPDYELARELADELPVPVIISGGLRSAESAREAFERSGAAAVALARGSLGNPWLFSQLLGERAEPPGHDEILAELGFSVEDALQLKIAGAVT